MDGDLLLIAIMIITIVGIVGGSVNAIVSKVIDYKKSQNLHSHGAGEVQAGQLADRTAMIEDRLAVLERIATDRGHLLAEEIEALRDDVKSRENA